MQDWAVGRTNLVPECIRPAFKLLYKGYSNYIESLLPFWLHLRHWAAAKCPASLVSAWWILLKGGDHAKPIRNIIAITTHPKVQSFFFSSEVFLQPRFRKDFGKGVPHQKAGPGQKVFELRCFHVAALGFKIQITSNEITHSISLK